MERCGGDGAQLHEEGVTVVHAASCNRTPIMLTSSAGYCVDVQVRSGFPDPRAYPHLSSGMICMHISDHRYSTSDGSTLKFKQKLIQSSRTKKVIGRIGRRPRIAIDRREAAVGRDGVALAMEDGEETKTSSSPSHKATKGLTIKSMEKATNRTEELSTRSSTRRKSAKGSARDKPASSKRGGKRSKSSSRKAAASLEPIVEQSGTPSSTEAVDDLSSLDEVPNDAGAGSEKVATEPSVLAPAVDDLSSQDEVPNDVGAGSEKVATVPDELTKDQQSGKPPVNMESGLFDRGIPSSFSKSPLVTKADAVISAAPAPLWLAKGQTVLLAHGWRPTNELQSLSAVLRRIAPTATTTSSVMTTRRAGGKLASLLSEDAERPSQAAGSRWRRAVSKALAKSRKAVEAEVEVGATTAVAYAAEFGASAPVDPSGGESLSLRLHVMEASGPQVGDGGGSVVAQPCCALVATDTLGDVTFDQISQVVQPYTTSSSDIDEAAEVVAAARSDVLAISRMRSLASSGELAAEASSTVYKAAATLARELDMLPLHSPIIAERRASYTRQLHQLRAVHNEILLGRAERSAIGPQLAQALKEVGGSYQLARRARISGRRARLQAITQELETVANRLADEQAMLSAELGRMSSAAQPSVPPTVTRSEDANGLTTIPATPTDTTAETAGGAVAAAPTTAPTQAGCGNAGGEGDSASHPSVNAASASVAGGSADAAPAAGAEADEPADAVANAALTQPTTQPMETAGAETTAVSEEAAAELRAKETEITERLGALEALSASLGRQRAVLDALVSLEEAQAPHTVLGLAGDLAGDLAVDLPAQGNGSPPRKASRASAVELLRLVDEERNNNRNKARALASQLESVQNGKVPERAVPGQTMAKSQVGKRIGASHRQEGAGHRRRLSQGCRTLAQELVATGVAPGTAALGASPLPGGKSARGERGPSQVMRASAALLMAISDGHSPTTRDASGPDRTDGSSGSDDSTDLNVVNRLCSCLRHETAQLDEEDALLAQLVKLLSVRARLDEASTMLETTHRQLAAGIAQLLNQPLSDSEQKQFESHFRARLRATGAHGRRR